jgi:large subunit ribosomal protein L14
MIQMQTRLAVADNTGAKEVMCFKVLGGSRKRTAGLGDIIVCSVKSVISGSDVKKKAVVKAVIVRCRKATRRDDGSYMKIVSLASEVV